VSPAEDEWPTRFKYLLADFENYRRRSERDREMARQSARADLLRAMIPLFETFGRGLSVAESLDRRDPLRKGLELLAHEWTAFWKAEGVESVARVGERFHADAHEAVAEAPPTPDSPAGTIVEVVQQGYRARGGLLRPAKVVVARGDSVPSEPVEAVPADPYEAEEE
jgi:molecular chaperone GrpE